MKLSLLGNLGDVCGAVWGICIVGDLEQIFPKMLRNDECCTFMLIVYKVHCGPDDVIYQSDVLGVAATTLHTDFKLIFIIKICLK